jgi:pimeloyl-ACP methyl ester carboxylesterase
MLAADLAVFRPEAVTGAALLAPFGIFDEAEPGLDIYAVPTAERMSHLFAKGVPDPFAERFAELGPDDGPVARYLSDVAAANLLWPLGDRGLARRIHRIDCPTLVLWGELDELLPVAGSAAWAAHGLPVEVVAGAGHLLEWDEPGGVAGHLVQFLADLGGRTPTCRPIMASGRRSGSTSPTPTTTRRPGTSSTAGTCRRCCSRTSSGTTGWCSTSITTPSTR